MEKRDVIGAEVLPDEFYVYTMAYARLKGFLAARSETCKSLSFDELFAKMRCFESEERAEYLS